MTRLSRVQLLEVSVVPTEAAPGTMDDFGAWALKPKRVRRCTARHPLHAEVRCEEPAGHSGQHAHSFYARYWEDA